MKQPFLGVIISGLLAATSLNAQTAPAGQTQVPPNPTQSPAPNASAGEKYFTDVELVNQNGKKFRFYSDLLKGKVVIISSFTVSCTSACPGKNRNLEKIQDAVGARLGKDILILSITVDPVTDTPARLKEYAKIYNAQPGWHFLSGKKENVDWALYKIGQYVVNKEEHVNILVVGNETTGLWKKAFALASSAELIKIVESVINDKPADVK